MIAFSHMFTFVGVDHPHYTHIQGASHHGLDAGHLLIIYGKYLPCCWSVLYNDAICNREGSCSIAIWAHALKHSHEQKEMNAYMRDIVCKNTDHVTWSN